MPPAALSPLDSARRKAFRRLLPLCFICYVIAYVDRANVAVAKLNMVNDLKGFSDAVFAFGAGVFFIGYVLLEIPGTLIVEKWSARKWISRIMLSWGVVAALTAFVKTPVQFYTVRFFLGLAEAGFFPGIIVYLTHWFPSRDRARALATFLVATPTAQIISPKISNLFMAFGTDEVVNGVTVHRPELLGLEGWQWVYIIWGLPAVVLGVIVLLYMTDRPRQARWLTLEERDALEAELERERAAGVSAGRRHMKVLEAIRHPKVLLLALAYFMTTSANYGVEFFQPTILKKWYSLNLNAITWLVILPPLVALCGQLFVGWSSDRTKERRFHAIVPLLVGATAMAVASQSKGNLVLTVACFMIAYGGIKAYQPAFWSLPSQLLTGTAAAGSIGFINSVGNLGGFFGPNVIGVVQKVTGGFQGGLLCLAGMMIITATTILLLGLGKKEAARPKLGEPERASGR